MMADSVPGAAAVGLVAGDEGAQRRADLVPHLLDLHDVYRALLKQRAERGAVDFETTETQIVCDDNGRIEKIVPRVRTEAHRLIEECMLAANVCAAHFIEKAKHPSLYRVHEGPTPEKKAVLQAYLKALGLGLSISYQIAEAHGGRLDVVSRLGIGTRFMLSLPRRSRAQPEVVAHAPQGAVAA